MNEKLKQLFNEQEAADYLGYSVHSLRKSRFTNTLGGVTPPKFIKVGVRAIRYKRSDLDQWIEMISGE